MIGVERTSIRIAIGKRAGCLSKSYGEKNRISIRVDGRLYLGHVLAWCYVYGHFPDFEIDHSNGDSMDNRIENLRPATKAENGWNRGKNKNNKSGFKGVTFDACRGKWKASIGVHGKVKQLGRFSSPEAASSAYEIAAQKFCGQFARVT